MNACRLGSHTLRAVPPQGLALLTAEQPLGLQVELHRLRPPHGFGAVDVRRPAGAIHRFDRDRR